MVMAKTNATGVVGSTQQLAVNSRTTNAISVGKRATWLLFCRKKKRAAAARSEPKREQAHQIVDNGFSDKEYVLHWVSSGSSKLLLVTVKLNGVDTEMEVHTGSSVSIMCEEKFCQLEICYTSRAKLFTYTREAIGAPQR